MLAWRLMDQMQDLRFSDGVLSTTIILNFVKKHIAILTASRNNRKIELLAED